MVWKRNFLYLVCVGSLFVVAIFFTYRDEIITGRTRLHHSQAAEYYTENPEVERLSTVQFRGNHFMNREILYRQADTHGLFHLSRNTSSQIFLSKNEESKIIIEPTVGLTLADNQIYTKYSSLDVTRLLTDRTSNSVSSHNHYKDVERMLQPLHTAEFMKETKTIKTVKSINEHYTNVFQWNDRDPDGGKNLPFSHGEYATQKERVIFNRVGKCGSRSMITLLRDLAQNNNFNLISSIVYNQTHISNSWEKRIVSILDQVQTPYLFQRHLHYINFHRHNASEVVYINVIREPIPRMVSQYYFARFGDGLLAQARAKWKRTTEEFNETVDECVQNEHNDCSGHRTFYIIPFFCGNSKRCTVPSRWALQRAIYNVERHFIFVGILEEFELTLKVLERVLPAFFSGASNLYHTSEIVNNVSRTSTSRKIPPSNETLAILKKKMKYEYHFYKYIKEKLHRQAEKYGLR